VKSVTRYDPEPRQRSRDEEDLVLVASQADEDDDSDHQRQTDWEEEDLMLLATQAEDEDFELNGQLFGCMNTKVVGIRYYSGVATMGERVIVLREPDNKVSTCIL